MAAQEGRWEVARALICAGADRLARDSAGWTPVHYAANHRWASWGQAPLDDHIEVLNVLFSPQRGSPFSQESRIFLARAVDDDGSTALHAAAHSGRAELCAALMEHGVPPSSPPGTHSPLHVAASHGRLEVLRLLLSVLPRSAIEQRDERGMTPLLVACAQGSVESILILVQGGALLDSCVTLVSPAGEVLAAESRPPLSPLSAALRSCSTSAIALLLAMGCRRGLRESRFSAGVLVRQIESEIRRCGPAGADTPQGRSRAERLASAQRRHSLYHTALQGVPLEWSPASHSRFPTAFKERVRGVLLSLAPLRELQDDLPLALREHILYELVFEPEARAAVWPALCPQKDWPVVRRGSALRKAMRLPEHEDAPACDFPRPATAAEEAEWEAVQDDYPVFGTDGETDDDDLLLEPVLPLPELEVLEELPLLPPLYLSDEDL